MNRFCAIRNNSGCIFTISVILVALATATATAAPPAAHERTAASEGLDVPLDTIVAGPPRGMMRRYLLRQADAAAKHWKDDYEQRKTPEQIAAYQKRLRRCFLDAIGGLPERTPLEPQVVGTVSRPGYRVEKIVFQSRPRHYVTALLFLPDAKRFPSPRPGVLVPCGHAPEGKGNSEYQAMGALLALNGMAALVFDPIDQGERRQLLGKAHAKLLGTTAHLNVGVGCILLGQNTARFEIWDGLRAIDYLQSRPEVDPRRIGCTGNSGGGTQTSYLMALDDRIGCAAPSCYLTSFARLLKTVGPQDAEQNIFGQLAFGMDHGDLLMMRAPSPVLLCAATRDFFDIEGTWQTFRAAKRLYTRLGMPERIDILEADTEHGYGLAHRQGAARWMTRWLMADDRPIVSPTIELLSQKEYQCLPDGEVMRLPGARSVYDLNEECENQQAKRRAAAWAGRDRARLFDTVRRLAGVRRLAELPTPKVESFGTSLRDGIRVERLVLRPEEGIALPALLFQGAKTDRVVLYVNAAGKSAGAGKDGPIERFVREGAAVLAVDPRGTGQTQAIVNDENYNPEYQDASIAYLLGRSYVGMRAEDILVAARYAAARLAWGRSNAVRLVAVGNLGVPALHAAALEPELFESVAVSRSLRSWADVIHGRVSRHLMTAVVHGALGHYDLPDLSAAIGPKLTIDQPIDAVGHLLADKQ